MDLSYQRTLKATLAPEQVREAPMLASAEADEPYRKHVIIQ